MTVTLKAPSAMKFLRPLLLLCMLWGSGHIRAQEVVLSPEARISVLTCGPGTELYSTFGHTAFRVQDPLQGIDWIYNYGTFDFNTPNFYMKFARGKLKYALSRQTFPQFLYTYQLENRWVREQWLQLEASQRQDIFLFLQNNHKPENRFYHYDFLRENCATKIPEVLMQVLRPDLTWQTDHLTESMTFRDLIQQNLDRNSWSSLGIDLALGARVDRQAQPQDYLFLPDYVMQQLDHSRLGSKELVGYRRAILDLQPTIPPTYFTASPLFWMLVLLLLSAAITWIDYRNGSRSRVLDLLLFSLTGLSGLVVFFLWFFTDHHDTVWNANILWAFPLNAVAAYFLLRKKTIPGWMPRYLLFLLAAIGLCLLIWMFGIQRFSPLLPVLWLALALRYVFLYRYLNPKA